MLKRALLTLTLLCLMTGTLFAADDPFVGMWMLNFAKSDIDKDQLKIEDLGGNKYEITSHNASRARLWRTTRTRFPPMGRPSS